jgi:hypothetical protein
MYDAMSRIQKERRVESISGDSGNQLCRDS